MNVTADVRRRDLLLVGLLLLPRSRANWYFIAIVGAGVFVYLMLNAPAASNVILIAELLLSFVVGVGALLGGFLGNAVCMLVNLEKNSGVLGAHDFSLSPAQLRETTAFNDSQYTWWGIRSVERLGSYILVRVNKFSMFVIPRRAFGSHGEFDAFFQQANAWKQAADKNAAELLE
jgi:hypothetical protein